MECEIRQIGAAVPVKMRGMFRRQRLKIALALLAALGLVCLGVQGAYLLLLCRSNAGIHETYLPQPL